MTPNFRLEVALPKTQVANAFTKIYTQQDQAVQSIEVELKKEKGRCSFMTVQIRDPLLRDFAKFPDPAFSDIPVSLYIVEPGKSPSTPVLAFQGKVTAMHASWPSFDLEIVAHDNSIDMRRRAKLRTFKGMTSVQVTMKIASEYGLSVDSSALGDVQLLTRTVSIGMAAFGNAVMSDWGHCVRELNADGLTVHCHGSKLYVQQLPTNLYPQTFQPGDGKVIDLRASINHVRGPGDLGNKSSSVAMDHAGTDKAVSGASAAEANKEKEGDARTHQRPVGGMSTKTKGAHTEDIQGAKWQNQVTKSRGRKDECTLTLNPTPGIFLTHLIPLKGFAGKIDGNWEVVSVKQTIVPGDGRQSETAVSLARGVSSGAAKQAGSIPFSYAGAK